VGGKTTGEKRALSTGAVRTHEKGVKGKWGKSQALRVGGGGRGRIKKKTKDSQMAHSWRAVKGGLGGKAEGEVRCGGDFRTYL